MAIPGIPSLIFLFSILEVAAGQFCSGGCDRHSYCCDEDLCCAKHRYPFYSVWYFWFIIGMLILACSASCSYYRRRRRLLALRNHMPPAGVVMFSSGNRQHAPQHPMTAQQPMPPSYQEATDKSFAYPPPYYAIDPYSGQNVSGGFINMQIGTNVPPYPANTLQVEAPQNRPLNQQPSS